MKIEVKARWVDDSPISDEEREIRNLKALNNPDYNEEYDEPQRFIYKSVVFDLKDIRNFNESDQTHTTIRFYEDNHISVHIPYEAFKSIYKEFTGEVIKTIVIKEEADTKKTNKKQVRKNDDEDINLHF